MWPFKRKSKVQFQSWPIVRTQPVARTYGRAISIFINNWHCHLATVDAYEDGSIDCWGFVDRFLFKEKVQSRWIVTAPKPDQAISVFNFGMTNITSGKWVQSSQDILNEVNSTIKAMNPEMKNLLDMEGSDTETCDGVRRAKLMLPDEKLYRRSSPNGTDILGDRVPVLKIVPGGFELTQLMIFSDEMCQFGETLIPITNIPAMYEQKEICNVAPAGSTIALPGLGEFQNTREFGYISEQDRILEIRDIVSVLNGKPSIVTTCVETFRKYTNDPSTANKDELRATYEAVPEHLRGYCGAMDSKDFPIRRILYGEEESAS